MLIHMVEDRHLRLYHAGFSRLARANASSDDAFGAAVPLVQEDNLMKTIALSALLLGAVGFAANAEPVKLGKDKMDQVVAGKITTTNPGGQGTGCGGGNPNCAATNPAGQQPGGHNK